MYKCGFILICLGIIFLLRNLGIIKQPVWSILWPAILIAIGIEIIIGTKKLKRFFSK